MAKAAPFSGGNSTEELLPLHEKCSQFAHIVSMTV